MESKQGFTYGGIAKKMGLLIEPVWNRNTVNSIQELRGYSLLIEPVWNRNISASYLTYSAGAFNRISMESKR